MEPRYFTVDDVNELLPWLEGQLSELREVHRQIAMLQRQMEQAARHTSDGNGLHVVQENQTRVLQSQVETAVDRFRRLVQEVAALGAGVKDPEQGLVDFLALRDGREVYLCWRVGETECSWWHDLEAGFGGRQPLV